jgi:hypothetical protein
MFSQQWGWCWSSGFWRRVDWLVDANVSEKHILSPALKMETMFLRNGVIYRPVYTAPEPRTWTSSEGSLFPGLGLSSVACFFNRREHWNCYDKTAQRRMMNFHCYYFSIKLTETGATLGPCLWGCHARCWDQLFPPNNVVMGRAPRVGGVKTYNLHILLLRVFKWRIISQETRSAYQFMAQKPHGKKPLERVRRPWRAFVMVSIFFCMSVKSLSVARGTPCAM